MQGTTSPPVLNLAVLRVNRIWIMAIRKIDTIDGTVKCRLCYDVDKSSLFVEFSRQTGYDDESDPYEYVGESDFLDGDFDELTDEQLENMYYDASK